MSMERRNRSVRIRRKPAPRSLAKRELPQGEALIRREGDRPALEVLEKKLLRELLKTLGSLDEEFPDVDEDLPLLREIDL